MFTLMLSNGFVVSKVVLLLLVLCGLRLCALAGPVQQQNTQHLYCSVGYQREECEGHLATLNAVLVQYPTSKLGSWTWILVTSEEWDPLLRRLHLDDRSIAFSSLEQRTIVLEEALFLPHGIRANKLARNLRVRPDQLVSLAVSHELGHVLCRDSSEEAASRVAEQLRNGKHPECGGNSKSLTRMEELLYQQSRTLGQSVRR